MVHCTVAIALAERLFFALTVAMLEQNAIRSNRHSAPGFCLAAQFSGVGNGSVPANPVFRIALFGVAQFPGKPNPVFRIALFGVAQFPGKPNPVFRIALLAGG